MITVEPRENELDAFEAMFKVQAVIDFYRTHGGETGYLNDGYHTFDDLYEQRMILSAALAKNNPCAWKSHLHDGGAKPFGGGWFIMGWTTPEGDYTYHYEDKYWDLFECAELPEGKPWDGHRSNDVRRLLSMTNDIYKEA